MCPRRVAGSRSGTADEAGAVDDPAAARAAAIALLARRDLPSRELRVRLEERGFGHEAVTAALDALAGEGTVNDERYANNHVAYHAARGQGPIRIATQLRTLGLPQPLIEAALDAVPNWPALAAAARIRRFGAPAPASWRQKARQARFLQYRGFSADHIRAATGADPGTD